jgi:integrase
MTIQWIKTAHKGLRYYEHQGRKHGKQRDRYYSIRFRVDKKLHEYGIGWMSDGIPEATRKEEPELGFQDYCLKLLRQYKGNVKTGEGAKSPKERRSIEETEKAVEAAEQERIQEESVTVAEYCKDTYFPDAKLNKAPNTYRVEDLLFTHWVKPVIGAIPLTKVAQIDIQRAKQAMVDAKKSPKTIHHTLGLIRQIYNHAKRPDIYLRAKVKMPKIDNAKLRYLTAEEIVKLLLAVKAKSLIVHDQAVLAVNCGLRFSEAAGLRWEDVNYETGSMSIRDSKTGSRTVFLNDVVADMLRQRQGKKTTGPIFPEKKREGTKVRTAEGTGQPRSASNTFQRIADELFNKGVDDRRLRVTFHTLRHSFGTHVYANSGDLYLTQKALGHRTMVMASRYAKMSETRLREAFTKMSDVMKKGRETNQEQNDKAVNSNSAVRRGIG